MITILEAIKKHMEQGEDLVLAVVRETEGSVPRGKGAAMLAGPSGILKGSVGGGVLEAEVLKAAQDCLAEKRSASLTFSLGTGGQIPTGMICGGTAAVWLQYIRSGDRTWQEQCDQALLLLKDGCSAQLSFDSFSLPLDPPDRALLFGGGHIAKALTPILASVGFRVVVMDERPEFATNVRFPNAAQVVCGDFGHLDRLFTFRENDYAVVVTSGHVHDFEVEEQLLRKELAYVGVIGSRKKTAAVNAKLKASGIPEEKLAQVHTPIGLDIGAVTPEEIAVSIAAEMIAVRAERRKNGR